jgi:hypothetical protein
MVKSRDKRLRAADKNGMIRRPNGVYYLTWRSFQRKYKSNSFISFGFMPGNQFNLKETLDGIISRRTGKKMRTTFKEGAKYKGFYVYPFIAVRIRGEGIL